VNETVDSLSTQISHLTSLCTQFTETIKGSHTHFTSSSPKVQPLRAAAASHTASTDHIDRSRNVILFGIEECQDASVWRDVVTQSLHEAAGRDVMIDDAFRWGNTRLLGSVLSLSNCIHLGTGELLSVVLTSLLLPPDLNIFTFHQMNRWKFDVAVCWTEW